MGIIDRLVKRVVPRTRKGKWRVVVYGLPVVLLALDMGLVRWWRRVPVGAETTRVTVVNGEGYPDYLGWINDKYGAGVTRENNAAVGLLEVVGYSGDAALLRAMGMGGERLKGLMFSHGYDYPEHPSATTEETWRATAGDMQTMRSAPWKATEHPRWAALMAKNEPGLTAFHRAMQRDRYFVPAMVTGGVMRGAKPGALSEENASGEATALTRFPTRMLQLPEFVEMHAQMRLGNDDWQGFETDAADLLKLSRLLGTGWSSSDMYAAEIVEDAAVGMIRRAIPRMPEASAARWMRLLEEHRRTAEWMRTLNELERFRDLDRAQAILLDQSGSALGAADAEVSGVHDPRTVPLIRALWPVNSAEYLREINRWYDQMLANLRTAPPGGGIFEFVRGDQRQAVWWHFPPPLAHIDLLAWDNVSWNDLLEARLRLVRVALALRVFRLEQGAYPEKLEELTRIIGHVPDDVFGAGPLKYSRRGGGYVLYSVGHDGVDDGGVDFKSGQHRWDEVVRVGE